MRQQKFNSLTHTSTHKHSPSCEDIKMQALTETYPNMFELDAFS